MTHLWHTDDTKNDTLMIQKWHGGLISPIKQQRYTDDTEMAQWPDTPIKPTRSSFEK